jgi:DNA-binding protein YbaB
VHDLSGSQILGISGGLAADTARKLDELRARMRQVGEALELLREQKVTGKSADGNVSATVDGTGGLLAVNVSAKAMRALGHEQLGVAAREAILAARRESACAFTKALADATGEAPPAPGETEIPADPMAELRRTLTERDRP